MFIYAVMRPYFYIFGLWINTNTYHTNTTLFSNVQDSIEKKVGEQIKGKNGREICMNTIERWNVEQSGNKLWSMEGELRNQTNKRDGLESEERWQGTKEFECGLIRMHEGYIVDKRLIPMLFNVGA